jgi:hypothetical protein
MSGCVASWLMQNSPSVNVVQPGALHVRSIDTCSTYVDWERLAMRTEADSLCWEPMPYSQHHDCAVVVRNVGDVSAPDKTRLSPLEVVAGIELNPLLRDSVPANRIR